ncbi:MAG: hypothetical protein HC817_03325 [Saprospiraceae bacterium]|nr:hypothetical protein [Saprospiraceae bacterium]
MKLTAFFSALLFLFTSNNTKAQTVSRLQFDFSDNRMPLFDGFMRATPQDIFTKTKILVG